MLLETRMLMVGCLSFMFMVFFIFFLLFILFVLEWLRGYYATGSLYFSVLGPHLLSQVFTG